MVEIREAQSADVSLQTVIQALKDQAQPPHSGIREYPEDACILLSQSDSLVLLEGVAYCKLHYPDSSMNLLQIVLLANLHRSYVERLHADLGHFWQAKSCMAVSRHVYFPGWRSFTGLLVIPLPTRSSGRRYAYSVFRQKFLSFFLLPMDL